MITFKDFLTESRSAPLYHATTIDKFYGIMKSGKIEARTNHAGVSPMGVSLTRSINTAFKWKAPCIVIEVDHEKLAQAKKIRPINILNIWMPNHSVKGGAKAEELFEEFVKGPIESKYFKQFIVKSPTFKYDYYHDMDMQLKALRRLSHDFPQLKLLRWDTKSVIKPGRIEMEHD